MSKHNNDGVYFPDPGTVKKARCGICNEKMDVKRNVYGPTQRAMAVSGSKRMHDFFKCPNYDKPWHKRAADLKAEKYQTTSRKVRQLISEEIREILKTRELHSDD